MDVDINAIVERIIAENASEGEVEHLLDYILDVTWWRV